MNDPSGKSGDVTIDSHMMQAMVNGDKNLPGYDKVGEQRMSICRKMEVGFNPHPAHQKYKGAGLGAYPALADSVRVATDTTQQRKRKLVHTVADTGDRVVAKADQ